MQVASSRPPFKPSSSTDITLSLADLFKARRLSEVLSKIRQFAVYRPELRSQVTMGSGRIVRGPEGQPLIPVPFGGGAAAYVDPNTNQYYVGQAFIRGGTMVQGPFALPPAAQFSNSHFSDADVQALSIVAHRGAALPSRATGKLDTFKRG